MKKLVLKIFFVVCSLLVLTREASSQDLTLITENAPPNSYMENGVLTGRAVEVVQAVLKEIGMVDYKINMYPWARGYMMLETKKNIALFATSRTQFRENLFKWAGPISDNEVNLYKLKSRKDVEVTTLDDLKKYRVGSGRDDQKTQYLASKGVELHIVAEDKQNVEKLFLGRIDVMPYAAGRLKYDIVKCGYDPGGLEAIFEVKEISTDIYVAFSMSTDDSIVQKIQEGFDAIREKGIQEIILNKWK